MNKKIATGLALGLAILVAAVPVQALEWTIETVDSESYLDDQTSLAFDTSGNPLISYLDCDDVFENYDLKHAWKSGGAWHNETVDSWKFSGDRTSLAFDASGNPHISYSDIGVKYA